MLNFSEWDAVQPSRRAGQAAEAVRRGSMPPWDFLLLHPEARLSPAEKQALIDGLMRTFGDDGRRTGSTDPSRELMAVAMAARRAGA